VCISLAYYGHKKSYNASMSIKSRKFLASWLPLAFVITVACAAAYGVGQQVLRQSANDPQVGMAEDAATRLMQGTAPAALVGVTVDVGQSASPAMAIYDEKNNQLASSLEVNGKSNVSPPEGVLNNTRKQGEHQITWQTADGTRLALVAVATSDHGDVVVAARSLKQVEERIDHLGKMVLAGWLLALGGSLALQWLVRKYA
jgi:hypothetical protein